MSDKKLNQQQLAAAQLLAIGTIDNQVGVSKQTLYNWINKNVEFMAEVDSVRQDFKNFGKQLMEARLVDAVDGYWDLIKKSKNGMVSAKGYEFFIERSLGKLTNNLNLTTKVNNIKPVDEDILEAEMKEFDMIEEVE
jgi:Helix-turn-helix of insertion element transposase